MILNFSNMFDSQPARPGRTWRKKWVIARIGRIDGDRNRSLLLLGRYETRISSQQCGRIWRACK